MHLVTFKKTTRKKALKLSVATNFYNLFKLLFYILCLLQEFLIEIYPVEKKQVAV